MSICFVYTATSINSLLLFLRFFLYCSVLRNLTCFVFLLFFVDLSRGTETKNEQEEARRAADEAHRAFAAYEGDLPTLLRVYEGFLKASMASWDGMA